MVILWFHISDFKVNSNILFNLKLLLRIEKTLTEGIDFGAYQNKLKVLEVK